MSRGTRQPGTRQPCLPAVPYRGEARGSGPLIPKISILVRGSPWDSRLAGQAPFLRSRLPTFVLI
jgi:hypothetical protein